MTTPVRQVMGAVAIGYPGEGYDTLRITPECRPRGVGGSHPSCGSVTSLEGAENMINFSDVRILLCPTPIRMANCDGWSSTRYLTVCGWEAESR